MKAVVVGAGIGGLSAACHLAGRGHDVTVVERADVPGGRAGLIEAMGYRFDTGPTVLTMPDILRATTEAAGVELESVLSLHRVDPTYRAVFADGSELRVRADREAMVAEITALAGQREADAFRGFADWLTELYRVELANFIDVDFDSPFGIMRHPLAMARLVRLGGFRKLTAKVDAVFADERLRRIFSFQAMYAGLSPLDALALYGVISYMDTIAGVYFPVGGMHAVPRALAEAATKAGTRIRYGESAERLSRSPSGRVDGVHLAGGDHLPADVVVVNADAAAAYRLAGADVPWRVTHGRYSPSCTVWIAGMKVAPTAGAAHHNIHFGHEWAGAFDALLRKGERMPDPSIMVTLPTKSDPDLAPHGRHIVYALEPVPNLDGAVAWRNERSRARDDLVARVSNLGYGDDFELEHFTDPLDWQAAGMEKGTPFALAHTFSQSGPFRPSTKARRVPGMVLVGSATRPGVGVPMVLLSGRLAADRAERVALQG
ncbi:MAG: phytoene desaturase family protein [Acidimicrobiia bacterium]